MTTRIPGLTRLRRWLLALAALLSGAAVAGGLLLVDGSDAGAVEYLMAVRDTPAGAVLTADSVRVERLRLGPAAAAALPAATAGAIAGRRAAHELTAGQLIQKTDLSAGPGPDRRLVWLALKDLPPLAAGDRIDLLQLSGPPDRLSVTPFALGVEVQSAGPGGVVVATGSGQAPALLYGAAAAHLVAVAAPGGTGPGREEPVGSFEQAQALLRR